jgi:GNAT superfamily N-acetyltransferase
MKTMHRAYSEEAGDFSRLCRFMIEHHDHIRDHSAWCLGRVVDWKYGLYGNKLTMPAFCDQNAHLWFDAFGYLVGFAISESGDAGFAILTVPGFRWLFGDMLDWALRNWGKREPCPSIEITEHQVAEACVLERSGFIQQTTFDSYCFDLTKPRPERAPLENGFTVVDLATHPDYRAQRILRSDAFSGQSSPTEEQLQIEVERVGYSIAGPIYHAQCDLCVMAEDGRFVSGCEALIDAHNLSADIERICTHSAFRRRGFARVVVQECMLRLQDLGMRRAYIAGYSPEALALYSSLGHVSDKQCLIYEKAA